MLIVRVFFFFQAEDGIRYLTVTGVQTCALPIYCWGDNAYGQLGTGTLTNSATPVAVTGGIGFDALATDGVHTCGLSSGTAYCWGDNASGELGDGSTASRSQPSAVSGSLTFSALAPGWLHTCGLSGSAAYCWGRNFEGQLGSGAPTTTPLPTADRKSTRLNSSHSQISYAVFC